MADALFTKRNNDVEAQALREFLDQCAAIVRAEEMLKTVVWGEPMDAPDFDQDDG